MVECIQAARDVLAALKLVHGEGMRHLNIQPSNIFRCKADGERSSQGGDFVYKLIGFGTVQDSGDTAAKEAVAALLEQKPYTYRIFLQKKKFLSKP